MAIIIWFNVEVYKTINVSTYCCWRFSLIRTFQDREVHGVTVDNA